MLSDEVKQTDLALSARGSSTTVRGLIGSRIERQERLPHRLPQEWVALDGEIDDYPSGAGLVAMFTTALFGMVTLAALCLFFYDPSSH